jgi:ABC-type dipeptide/oligopeptide/nickel transport system permease component
MDFKKYIASIIDDFKNMLDNLALMFSVLAGGSGFLLGILYGISKTKVTDSSLTLAFICFFTLSIILFLVNSLIPKRADFLKIFNLKKSYKTRDIKKVIDDLGGILIKDRK